MTDNVVFTAISGSSFLSVKRVLDTRSRAVASRDDRVSGFGGGLYGMTYLGDPFAENGEPSAVDDAYSCLVVSAGNGSTVLFFE